MLHELLLVLSAHESSIFRPWPPAPAPPETLVLDPSFANIHPSERVILNNLATLSFLHKQLRQSILALIHGHSSIVIRAVVSCANDSLHGFQLALEQVEKLILTRDDSVVGAFDIVPLSRLSALLGEWDRTIEYLHKFVSHIRSDSNGAQVLNRLHQDQHTGYPDIEAIVIKLIAAGEEAWLRQVSSWVLYGHVPLLGKSDFFVRQSADPNVSSLDENAFTVDWTLWPDHLPREIASSILFIGRSLARIQSHSTIRQISNRQILKEHLSLLNTVTFPLVPLALSKCINSIRLSLSSSVLSSLLPLDTVIRYVKRFRQDFLLGHGSLMLTLLNVTESYLINRADHDGGTIKEADVNNLLAKSWSIVSRYESSHEAEQEDEESKSYQLSLKLSLVKTPRTRNAQPPEVQHDTAFDDLLLGERIELKYEISWPLDLFLSRHDVEVYNKIFNFLLAMKKAQGQLTSIWPGRNFPYVSRRSWACLNYMLFFIDSLWSYFQATVIEPCFHELLQKLATNQLGDKEGYDPESLRSSHTTYLNNLLEGLFLSSNAVVLSRLLKQCIQQIDAGIEIIRQDEDLDGVRARGMKAIVDECVRELEILGDREGQGRIEKLLLQLDGGQWFTDNLHQNESDDK